MEKEKKISDVFSYKIKENGKIVYKNLIGFVWLAAIIITMVILERPVINVENPFRKMEKKQKHAFTFLMREICNNPNSLEKIGIVATKNGKEINIESKNVNELKKWYTFDQIKVINHYLNYLNSWDKNFIEIDDFCTLCLFYEDGIFSSSMYYPDPHQYRNVGKYDYVKNSHTLKNIRCTRRTIVKRENPLIELMNHLN